MAPTASGLAPPTAADDGGTATVAKAVAALTVHDADAAGIAPADARRPPPSQTPKADGDGDDSGDEDGEPGAAAAGGQGGRARRKKRRKGKGKDPLSTVRRYAEGLPVRIDADPIKGRTVRTTRALAPGDLVFEDTGVFVLLRGDGGNAGATTGFCDGCAAPLAAAAAAFRCPQCPERCCAACGPARQEAHERWCPVLRRAGALAARHATDPDLVRILAAIAMLKAEVDAGRGPPRGAELFNALGTLVTHRDAAAPDWLAAVGGAAQALLDACAELVPAVPPVKLTASDLVDMACRVNNNAYGVADPAGTNRTIGFGLYPLCGMLCHSCLPNAVFVKAPGGRLAIRAVRPIAADEELLVTYVDLYQDRRSRRAQLQATKHFWCACERCEWLRQPAPLPPRDQLPPRLVAELELDGLACACGGGVHSLSRADALAAPAGTAPDHAATPDPDAPVACTAPQCGRVRTRADVAAELERYEATVNDGLALASRRSYDGVERLLQPFLESTKAALAPRHVSAFSALMPLMNAARRAGRHGAVADLCAQTIACMDAVFPEHWAETSDFLQERAEALLADAAALAAGPAARRALAQRRRELAREVAERCAKVRSVCCGPDHPATAMAAQLVAQCGETASR